jgi:hypothetical protein
MKATLGSRSNIRNSAVCIHIWCVISNVMDSIHVSKILPVGVYGINNSGSFRYMISRHIILCYIINY